MEFNVSQLLKETAGSARSFEVNEELTLVEGSYPIRVVGGVEFLRTDKGIWVSALLDSTVPATCSRCLAECEQSLHMNVEEEFLLQFDVITGAKMEKPHDAIEYFFISTNNSLDLTEAARQYTELAIPMNPLCREDCAGICLECGVNLNDALCTCDKAPLDNRWSALLEFTSSSDN